MVVLLDDREAWRAVVQEQRVWMVVLLDDREAGRAVVQVEKGAWLVLEIIGSEFSLSKYTRDSPRRVEKG